MGLILDSSVVIAAERRGDTVSQFLKQVVSRVGDQEAALSSISVAELVHGIYRAATPLARTRREAFVNELLADVAVYSFTRETGMLAGKLDGELRGKGTTVPLADLLIGATALLLGYSILSINQRHFKLIPGLMVVQL